MTVVINPERNPADASWVGFSASSGEDCWIFFPIPNPMKLMAKMGATPTRGAPMPEKKHNILLTPLFSNDCIISQILLYFFCKATVV